MYNKKLKNCLCGNKPKLEKRYIFGSDSLYYFYYLCPECGEHTFSSRLKEFIVELWNSAIERKLKNKIK